LGLFTSLNQLGGGNTNDAASVGANFTVQRGIATTRDLTLASAFGNGGAAGSIDLPNWTIDLKGEVKLAESILIRLLKAKVRETRNAVPFAITGSLEAPNVKVDTGAALGAGVPIPGADALLNKAPKGVGNIIKGILGGGTSQKAPADNSGSQQQQQPQQQEQQQQPVTPERLLKDLFKRL